MRTILKTTAAGALLGGSLLAAGAGIASAQPQEAPEGLVNVTIGNVDILQGVSTETAATASAALCGSPVSALTAKAQQVVNEGTEQTACTGLPGGTLTIKSASAVEPAPGVINRTPGTTGTTGTHGAGAAEAGGASVTLPGATG
jgi:hypothetical protein